MFRHTVALWGFLLCNSRTPGVLAGKFSVLLLDINEQIITSQEFRGEVLLNAYVALQNSGRLPRSQLCDGATISVPSFPSIVTFGHNRAMFPVRV